MQVRAVYELPCPDFASFGDKLDKAAANFDRLSGLNLLPVWEADRDDTRAGIDDAVSEMLGIPDYNTYTLARIW